MNRTLLLCMLVLAITLCVATAPAGAQAQSPYRIDWSEQFGTAFPDFATDVSVDALGNAYIAGTSDGLLDGAGPSNVTRFLAKYDADGNRLWTRQDSIGPDPANEFETALGVSTDRLGSVYVSGIFSSADCCDFDPYLSKYDDAGNLLWTRTIRSDFDESLVRVSADPLGNVYIAGSTEGSIGGPSGGFIDAFVAKYDDAGNLQWIRQFGTSDEDEVHGISTDGLGNVYLAGWQAVSDDGDFFNNAFVTKFDSDGNQLWTRHLGSDQTFDIAYDVHADGLGGIYVAGQTETDLQSPPTPTFESRPFVVKFDDSGQLIWASIVETEPGFSLANGVVTDASATVHVVGILNDTNSTNAFVAKLRSDGVPLGILEFDSGSLASFEAVDSDGLHVYAVGGTRDSLFGPNAGDSDAIIAQFAPIPEPGSLALAALAALGLSLFTPKGSSGRRGPRRQ